MRFHVLFDTTDDASAFALWCEETGADVRDTWDRDGCPYPRGRILEVRIADEDFANMFAELWSAWIVSFGSG